jgi:hypothetical protein
MKIKLYHGTSEKNYDLIKKQGFLNPGYLTSDDEQANYYAECVAEEDGSAEVILTVEVDTDSLRADTASYNEPLSYILKHNEISEDDWHEAIENGEIKYPSDDQWHISLECVKCVKNTGNIPLKDITYDGSLNTDDENIIIKAIKNEFTKSSKLKI